MTNSVAAESGQIMLGIGQQAVAASDNAGFAAAITAQNDVARIADVPNSLNPSIVDPAKAAAFAAALAEQEPETLRKLHGRTLRLDNQFLGVRATEPTVTEAFAGRFTLAVDDVRGEYVLAHSNLPIDVGLAKARSEEAQTLLRQAKADVKKAEADSVGGARYGELLARRSALAMAWRINARAWAEAEPSASEANAARDIADKEARTYARPAGGKG